MKLCQRCEFLRAHGIVNIHKDHFVCSILQTYLKREYFFKGKSVETIFQLNIFCTTVDQGMV